MTSEAVRASANNNKITQAEFDELYLASIDNPIYRPILDNVRHFRLANLLIDHGFSLDLSGLNLRNRNFKNADFMGIKLEGADLSGSVCDYVDFTGVSCLNIKADGNTKLFKAKLTEAQLLQLHAEPLETLQALEKKAKDFLNVEDSFGLPDFA
ncbi:MAG: hypothetical protein A3E87_06990 [Gammaproteobacteria bacterium RIFCSPHIGHO2_12_FULL_35_23]|nr:MAG: hypothetical protein A3E87_06990 [Gammaproteobacteria bacterium RIFCSPHIGHO2_12_FULL_35_23]